MTVYGGGVTSGDVSLPIPPTILDMDEKAISAAVEKVSAEVQEAAWRDLPPLDIKAVTQWGMQWKVIQCPADIILIGGARMGGKTYCALIDWLVHWSKLGGDASGLMVRQKLSTTGDLQKKAKALLEPFGFKWVEKHNHFTHADGAELRISYLDQPDDIQNYMGHSYTWILVEEVNHMPLAEPVIKLVSTLRGVTGTATDRRFLLTCNTDGAGADWLQDMFWDPAPGGNTVIRRRFPELSELGLEDELTLVFFPSLPTDNREMLSGDKKAMLRLFWSTQTSTALKRSWIGGEWGVFQGQFFEEFNAWKKRGAIRPFYIPSDWLRIAAFDWGFDSPFAFGLAAIAPDWFETESGTVIPKGALVLYQDWYGVKTNSEGRPMPNQGVRLTAQQVGEGIAELCYRDTPRIGGWADLSAFSPSGVVGAGGSATSVMQQLAAAEWDWYQKHGVTPPGGWWKADRRRTAAEGQRGGWNELRARLRGIPHPDHPGEALPMLFAFASCRDLFRTLPKLRHDPKRTEDLKPRMEDHYADMLRYMVTSRPAAEFQPPKPADQFVFRGIETWDQLLKASDEGRNTSFGSLLQWAA